MSYDKIGMLLIDGSGFSPNKTSGGIFVEKLTDNRVYII